MAADAGSYPRVPLTTGSAPAGCQLEFARAGTCRVARYRARYRCTISDPSAPDRTRYCR
jgi:hypothetical protein